MSDLIDRQAAIDEIKALYEWHDTVTEDRAVDHLKRLPSAQPYTDEEIQAMQDLEQAQLDKAYELGWKEGREALRREIWEDGRDRLD